MHCIAKRATQLAEGRGLHETVPKVAGNPLNELRLVAAMPSWTIPQVVSAAVLPRVLLDSGTSDGISKGAYMVLFGKSSGKSLFQHTILNRKLAYSLAYTVIWQSGVQSLRFGSCPDILTYRLTLIT